jgi:hypothetical protein
VDVAPRNVTRDHLVGASRAALGGGRRLDGVERVAGGTRKGVYRLTMDDATTAIAYLWEDSENFWPQTPEDGDRADQFSAGVGADLFEAAHNRLASLGLRVPVVYLLDRDRVHYPADLAIVEDFPGGDLLDWYKRDPSGAEPTLARLREGLRRCGITGAPRPARWAMSMVAECPVGHRVRRVRWTSRCDVSTKPPGATAESPRPVTGSPDGCENSPRRCGRAPSIPSFMVSWAWTMS